MYRPFDLGGKVALVTGGNRGIGFGMARALAEAGADILIWGRNAEQNRIAEAQLSAPGRRVKAMRVDIGDEQAVIDGMAEGVAAFGRIDAVFVNAGVGSGAARGLTDVTTPDWRAHLAINLDGAMWTMREAGKHFIARAAAGDPGGSIVTVASIGAVQAMPGFYPYTAAKAALLALSRSMAVEYARYGVRSNVIAPGWIETDMTASIQESESINAMVRQRVPLRRWGKPEDFGGIAVYLASDASAFHTGDVLVLDGGYSVF